MPNGEVGLYDFLRAYAEYLMQAYNAGLISNRQYSDISNQVRNLVGIIRVPTTDPAAQAQITRAYETLYALPGADLAKQGLEAVTTSFRRRQEIMMMPPAYTAEAEQRLGVEARETAERARQARELEGAKAFRERQAQEAAARYVKPLAPAAGMYAGFVERLPTAALRGYYGTRFPFMYAAFEREAGVGARETWLETRYQEAIKREKAIGARKRKRGRLLRGEVSRYGMVGAVAQRRGELGRAEKVSGRIRGLVAQRGREYEDPFAAFMAGYPFTQKFMELPPRERGFYPSRFRPPTRWI